ncbi:MAG: hypothetical protein H0W79_08730 [Rubrobacteraceae bacterium]|nr:hypothetical protein [Rubrobacteraceae bacterium]
MILIVVVGMLALQVLLFWGYVLLVERGSSTVTRGVLGTALVAALVVLALWLAFVTAFLRVE